MMMHLSQQRTKTLLAIHGWSAVCLSLLLYVVIVTGVASVFAPEIDASERNSKGDLPS
jgi:uncharacterized iron-regulated membrane protein